MALAGMAGQARADEANPADSSPVEGFSQWAIEGGNAGNSRADMFLSGEENRPTDEEIDLMCQAANFYFQCHGLTGVHFVIVKDPEELANIFGRMLMDNDGSGIIGVLAYTPTVR